MIRNLKVLGLALAAVFAMSAVAAAAASAQNGMVTAESAVTLTGVNTPEGGSNTLTSETGNVKCPEVLYTGHEVGSTTNGVTSGSSDITITPHYKKCTGPFGLPTTVDMNGCDYVFHIGGTVAENEYSLTANVICEGGHIKLTVYANETKHAEGIPFCTQTVTEKEGAYTGMTVKDNGDGTGRVVGAIEGVTVDSAGSFPCTNKNGVNAELDLDVTLTGDDAVGNSLAVSLSHE